MVEETGRCEVYDLDIDGLHNLAAIVAYHYRLRQVIGNIIENSNHLTKRTGAQGL